MRWQRFLRSADRHPSLGGRYSRPPEGGPGLATGIEHLTHAAAATQATRPFLDEYRPICMSSSRQSRDEERADDGPISHQVRTLCRTAFDSLVVVDDARRYVRLNESAAKLLGVPVEEVLNRRVGDFTPPEMLPAVERLWADFERHGAVHGAHEVLRGDGSRVLIEYRGARNFGPGQHLFASRIAAPQLQVAGVRASMRQDTLTAREREVLQLAARGHSTRKIAEFLHLRPSTIKTHFEHVYDKLGTHDRVSAVAECLRGGLIE